MPAKQTCLWFMYRASTGVCATARMEDIIHNMTRKIPFMTIFLWCASICQGQGLCRGCVKRFFTALRAELCFERHVIFTISLREIVKMTCLSEEYSAAVGGKNLFTQPRWRHLFLDFAKQNQENVISRGNDLLNGMDEFRGSDECYVKSTCMGLRTKLCFGLYKKSFDAFGGKILF